MYKITLIIFDCTLIGVGVETGVIMGGTMLAIFKFNKSTFQEGGGKH